MKKYIESHSNKLIKDGYLVKYIKFENHKYVGDVYNAVNIFSEKINEIDHY